MSLLDTYRSSHRHPKNQFFHLFGIPTIVAAIVVMFWNIRGGKGLFLFGWILQFAGHLFEKKPPAFVSNPVYLLVGPYWWTKEIAALLKKAWCPTCKKRALDRNAGATREISVETNWSDVQKSNRFPNPRVSFVEPMPPA